MLVEENISENSLAANEKNELSGTILRAFRRSLTLGWVFFTRDVKAKYRESFMGVLWAVIPTVVATLGFYVATQSEILKPGEGIGFPYAGYVFCGMMFWYLFVDTLLNSISAMKGARNILGRVSFPVVSIFLAAAFQSSFDFLIRLVLFGAISWFLGFWSEVAWYLFLPLGLCVVIWSLMLALFLYPFLILVQDMYRFLQIGLEYGVFVTPIAFQLPTNGVLKNVMRLNPLTYVIPSARDLALGINDSSLGYLIWGLPIGIVLFFVMVSIFNVCVPHLVERIS